MVLDSGHHPFREEMLYRRKFVGINGARGEERWKGLPLGYIYLTQGGERAAAGFVHFRCGEPAQTAKHGNQAGLEIRPVPESDALGSGEHLEALLAGFGVGHEAIARRGEFLYAFSRGNEITPRFFDFRL